MKIISLATLLSYIFANLLVDSAVGNAESPTDGTIEVGSLVQNQHFLITEMLVWIDTHSDRDMTKEERSFSERCLKESYNSVHPHSDYKAESFILVAEEHGSGEYANAEDTVSGSYGGGGWYFGSYGCDYCPNDDDELLDSDAGNDGIYINDEGIVSISSSSRKAWENAFTHQLSSGPYDLFFGVEHCTISMQGDHMKKESIE